MSIRLVVCTLAGASLAIALGGCTSGGGEDAETGATSEITVSASPNLVEDDGRFLVISEVGFGERGFVRLNNFTAAPASLAGLFLCQPPTCVGLPDTEVAPGETATIATGDGDGLDGVVMTGAGLQLEPADGEIGLYASEATDSTQDLRGYLEWGSTPHEGTPTAIEAGLWIEGSYLNSSPEATRVFKTEEQKWDWE